MVYTGTKKQVCSTSWLLAGGKNKFEKLVQAFLVGGRVSAALMYALNMLNFIVGRVEGGGGRGGVSRRMLSCGCVDMPLCMGSLRGTSKVRGHH